MKEWDEYWAKAPKTHNRVYDRIAVFYRKYIIKPYLKRYFSRYFPGKQAIHHAGCGSGQVEEGIIDADSVIGFDISGNALSLYKKNHPGSNLILGDIMATAFREESLDGIYNLGVMEHFSEEEAKLQIETAINWGRYAELFDYDAGHRRFILPDAPGDEIAEEIAGNGGSK